jgi:hypothetical protein
MSLRRHAAAAAAAAAWSDVEARSFDCTRRVAQQVATAAACA